MTKILIPQSLYHEVQALVQDWTNSCLGDRPFYEDALQSTIDQWGFPWFRSGVLVSNRNGEILMMHEARVQIKKIKDLALKQRLLNDGHQPSEWVDGDGGWNLPAGRLRTGESFEDAGLREVYEETGWDVVIRYFLYARHSEKPDNQYIMPVYLALPMFGPPSYSTVETSEIGWRTPAQIRAMADAGQLRSPDFVLDSLKAYEAISKSPKF